MSKTLKNPQPFPSFWAPALQLQKNTIDSNPFELFVEIELESKVEEEEEEEEERIFPFPSGRRIQGLPQEQRGVPI